MALDRVAKWLTITRLEMGESWDFLPAVGGFIRVTRSYNTGAAFGLFPSGSNVFLIVALLTSAVFLYLYSQLPDRAPLARLSIAMVVGGALSNAIDRIVLGHVIDYVHVQLTPTFANISNFADHAVTLGVALLLIDQWQMERAEKKQQALATADQGDHEELPADGLPEDREAIQAPLTPTPADPSLLDGDAPDSI
ncbi:MAG: hypothetical protein Kow00124_12780 [Anaerolineae bacterium]